MWVIKCSILQRHETANETEMTKEGAKCASGQFIVEICTMEVVKELWVGGTGFVLAQVCAISKMFLENHWLHWLLIRPDTPVRLTRLTSAPQLILAGAKIGLKGPGVGFSCHSRKQGTAGLLVIPVAVHIWANNHQKLKIWHKLRTRKMERFASIFFSRTLGGENVQLVLNVHLS